MRSVLVLVLAVPALAVAGCGGGDGEGGERLSQPQLVERANEVCADYDNRIEEIQEKYEGRITSLEDEDSLDALAEFARESRPAVEEGVDRLRELEPPEELEARYDDWIATGDDTADRIEELEDAAAAGDRGEVAQILERAEANEERSDRLATDLGLSECAED